MNNSKNNQISYLIIICIIFNTTGLFFPILRNDDPTLYASIAKNLILSGSWINLTHPLGVDWLDKPHFQFWVTALSFKLFGINSFAYVFPGFLFNLLGSYYTYKLAKYLFDKSVGLLSTLIYLSSFHLLLSSSVDVRAEAYLMGLIMPACYYYLRFFIEDSKFHLGNGFLGSLATACAIMTKGIFVVFTIGGGIFILLCYKFYRKDLQSFRNLIIKILLSIVLVAIFITPEIWALYSQFDSHPNKLIYNTTHVSGIKWFLWDSQFGRFFNTGPIIRKNSSSYAHYFFFIHTYMWAFLPWSIVFIAAIKHIISKQQLLTSSYLFLFSSFFITFVLFSLTNFQLDYYTNIIMPFSAIICAKWFYETTKNYSKMDGFILKFQKYLSFILVITIFIIGLIALNGISLLAIILLGSLILITFAIFRNTDSWIKAIFYPVISINFIFLIILLIYSEIYKKYDVGYNVAYYINTQKPQLPVVDYKLHSLTLEFYINNPYTIADDIKELQNLKKPAYVLTSITNLPKLEIQYKNKLLILKYFYGTTIDKVIKGIFNKKSLNNSINSYVLLVIR